eukprot:6186788-Pleurochrysis_carterae.AAC.2
MAPRSDRRNSSEHHYERLFCITRVISIKRLVTSRVPIKCTCLSWPSPHMLLYVALILLAALYGPHLTCCSPRASPHLLLSIRGSHLLQDERATETSRRERLTETKFEGRASRRDSHSYWTNPTVMKHACLRARARRPLQHRHQIAWASHSGKGRP